MILIAYRIPDLLRSTFVQLASELQAQHFFVDTLTELNAAHADGFRCILLFECLKKECESVASKSGAGAYVFWYTSNHPISKITDIYQFNLPDCQHSPELFLSKTLSLFHNSPALESAIIIQKFQNRLHLIHRFTNLALQSNNSSEIRENILTSLVDFYKAEACSYLSYSNDGVLQLVSRAFKDGSYRNEFFETIQNPEDYEECVECGDPIVNCSLKNSGVNRYFCAPILNGSQTTGLIRLMYDSNQVDISLDRTVLRICADILASTNIRDETLKALKESENRTRTILDTTVDAIITIDERGRIDTFNQAAEKLFGYKPEEVVGKNIQILMPEPYRQEHDAYLERYHKTGERQIIGIGREVVGKRKDNTTFPMYLAVSEFRLNDRRMYTGIVRDITEERRLEKEVMRISEHERHRIGQDLHDGLGQMLSGIGLLSKHVSRKLNDQTHVLAADMDEICSLIKEADDYSRGLARGLIKIDLDRGGFNAAIEELVRQSIRLFRIQCEFKATKEINLNERSAAEHLYRIIQEGINNAVKHGQANDVVISAVEGPTFIRFQIRDNGTGFSTNWREQEGLGVRIMEFRSRLIGAHIDISNNLDTGATVTCTLPKN